MRKTTVILIAVSALFPAAVIAGGVSWSFRVERVVEDSRWAHRIELRPLQADETFPLNCPLLTVHASYTSVRWALVGGKETSGSGHDQAMRVLKDAAASGVPVRFGSMGEGLGFPSSRSKCEVTSRALFVLEEPDGKQAIYSFYKWP